MCCTKRCTEQKNDDPAPDANTASGAVSVHWEREKTRMNYVIFDLEWNQPMSLSETVKEPLYLTGEIIEIL